VCDNAGPSRHAHRGARSRLRQRYTTEVLVFKVLVARFMGGLEIEFFTGKVNLNDIRVAAANKLGPKQATEARDFLVARGAKYRAYESARIAGERGVRNEKINNFFQTKCSLAISINIQGVARVALWWQGTSDKSKNGTFFYLDFVLSELNDMLTCSMICVFHCFFLVSGRKWDTLNYES